MRKTTLLVALALAVGFCAGLASGALIVDAGTWGLQPNQANQTIQISISGTGLVTNATVYVELGGDAPRPSITGGDIVTGTIFQSNNTGSPSYDFSDPTIGYLDVATSSGTVDGNGVLAKVVISTTGLSEGTWALRLTGTSWGDSTVGTDPSVGVSFTDGSITIIPEPGMLGLLGLSGLLVIRRRRGR